MLSRNNVQEKEHSISDFKKKQVMYIKKKKKVLPGKYINMLMLNKLNYRWKRKLIYVKDYYFICSAISGIEADLERR